ncbi:MAG: Ppx/GppA family phosphatase [Epsilonproteobacteria bacterium]|nr:Ppx/GppA family phosphatase [Campylobacterota bacterium]NPA57015.1 Ppx/GppA family phosphatase [Campylobacterota bacterium]
MARRTAVIDIGSNSARMIIVERTSRFGFYLLEEVKSRVRIGEGAYEHGGILQPEPMERALKALRDFLSIAHHFKVRKILSIATSALRDAPNRDLFRSRVRRELGLNIKIIDGESEALLGGIAAANLLPVEDGVTIDIGGGSTELALIRGREVVETLSLDLGTVRLKELFSDKSSPIEEVVAFVRREISRVPETFRSERVIGIGGTIRALSKGIMAKNNYPLERLHAFTYRVSDEIKFIEKIIEAPVSKLKKYHIKRDRYDTIKEGTLIFKELLSYLGAEEVVTSGVGIREGLFLKDLLRNNRYRFPNNFQPSVKSLLDRFCIDIEGSRCLSRLAKRLYSQLAPLFDPEGEYEEVLLIAAKLLNIGTRIDFYDHHKHSSYIVMNDLQYRLTHSQIATIGTLVRFHKRKLPSKSHLKPIAELLPEEEIIRWLSFILSLAETLNRDRSCPEFQAYYEDMLLLILVRRPLYLAQEGLKELEKPAPLAVRIVVQS